MGYTTEFHGKFNITPKLSEDDRLYLTKFSETRRMKRDLSKINYGIDGEWYVDGEGYGGQDNDPSVVDYNSPPSNQPSLWCQWVPTEDGTALVWDEGEKFYKSAEWLKYLINRYLAPRGYTVNGEVSAQGEDPEDHWFLIADNNTVFVQDTEVNRLPKKRVEWR